MLASQQNKTENRIADDYNTRTAAKRPGGLLYWPF